ncbi:MAG: hypothetical protein ACQESX_00345 [Bacteroidota bacterium]
MIKRILTIIITAVTLSLQAGETPGELLEAFKEKIMKVHDYKAKVNIKVEVDFVKIKDRNAVVLFEQPDTFKFSAGGFVLLPKKGVDMEYLSILQDDFTALESGTKTIRDKTVSVIRVIPDNEDKDLVMAKMFIHKESLRIYRMESFTKESGTYEVDFFYADHPYDLPDKLRVTFDIKNQKLPVSLTGDMEAIGKELEKEQASGAVILNYSDYEVNRKIE